MLGPFLRITLLMFLLTTSLLGCKSDDKLDPLAARSPSSVAQPPATIGNSAIVFDPASHDFGPAAQNVDTLNRLISLTNSSEQDIFISEFSGLNEHFSVLNSNCPDADTPLKSQASCQMTLQFTPQSAGTLSTTLLARYGPQPGVGDFVSLMGLSGTGVGAINFSGVTGADNVTHNSLRLQWTAEPQAVSYMIYRVIGSSLNFIKTVVNTGGTLSNHTLTDLNPNTTYVFRVRAMDSLGGQDGNTNDFSVSTEPNRAPVLQSITPPTFFSGVTLPNIDARDENTNSNFDIDGDPITYSCRFDNNIDGIVSSSADNCDSLVNEDGSSPTFSTTSGVLSGWRPRHADVGTGFEFAIEGTDPYGANSIVIFSGTIVAGTPARPLVLSVNPTSPANNNTPLVSGTSEANMTIRLFSNSTCDSALLGEGPADASGDWSVTITVPDDSVTTVFAQARNAIGNDSLCSQTSITYVEDSTPPSINVLSTTPSLFGTSTTPTVNGVSNPGASIEIFSDSACTVAEATGTANGGGEFAISVSLASEETKTFFARATDAAGNQSNCSNTSATYTAFPIDPDNLLIWLDSKDQDTLFQANSCTGSLATDVGHTVSCWRDKSGSNNHFTNTSNQPTRSADSVLFNGTNSILTNSGVSLNANSTVSYFLVVRVNTQSGTSSTCCRPFVSWVTSTSGLYPWVGVTRTGLTPANNVFFGWTSGALAPIPSSPGDEFLIGAFHDGASKNWNTSVFGSQNIFNHPIPGSYGSTTSLGLGGDPNNGARRYAGEIMEFIMYDEILSQERRQNIEGYLACKYDHRDLLPTDHPFYNSLGDSPNGCPN